MSGHPTVSYFKIDNLQPDDYCFEVSVMRPNDKNQTTEDFGDIDVQMTYMNFDRQNQRAPLRVKGGVTKLATIHANATYQG